MAIAKLPVGDRRFQVGELGLKGNEQQNRKHHGDPNQAVSAYASEDVAFWSAGLALPFDSAILGENPSRRGASTSTPS